jgi:hypothetical protein
MVMDEGRVTAGRRYERGEWCVGWRGDLKFQI